MSLKGLLIAAILIVYSLESLSKLHWSINVVFWLILALGVVYLYEWLIGFPAVSTRVHRRRATPEIA